MEGEAWGDARAALGNINRKGLGETRRIATGRLWIQEVAARDRLKFKKVLGRDNLADLYTKYLDEKTCGHHLDTLAYRFTKGRAEEAPQLHGLSQSNDLFMYGQVKRCANGPVKCYRVYIKHGNDDRRQTITVRRKFGYVGKVMTPREGWTKD